MISIYKDAVKDALYPKKKGIISERNHSLSVAPVKEMKGSDIRKLRKSLSLSASVFASVLGVSAKTLQAWERDASRPSGSALRLMEMMKKSPDFLIEMGIITESFT